MKHNVFSKALTFLLLLSLVFSLFSGASASAATGSISANSGKRDTVCTALSTQAKAYYTGSYAPESLFQLSGASSSSSSYTATQNNPLYSKLRTLMRSTHTYYVTYSGTDYGSLAYYWKKTDTENSGSNYLYFYTDILSSSISGETMNREHVWPKSKASFYQINGGSDLHHLRPSISTVNAAKNNYTFANVREEYSSYSTCYVNSSAVIWYNDSSEVLEVRDNVKGDVARILLYLYCRWSQPNLYTNVSSSYLPSMDSDDSTNTGLKAIKNLTTLLEWCEMDPVDTWEMRRNDQTENVQGNRNVFIDYPEFAWLIFGKTPPTNMDTPSGIAKSGNVYGIKASVNNGSYGSVSVSGNVITATPASGYRVSSYTILSGTPTVTQNGNTFTVTTTSSCSIRINFAKLTACTISFNVPDGVTQGAISGYKGDSITLPSPSGTPSANAYSYSFEGWVTSTIDGAVTKPTTYSAGTSYELTGNKTFYALYSYSIGSTKYYSTTLTSTCAHSYQANVTPPTCLLSGYTTYVCTLCQSSYTDDYVAPLGHSYTDGACENCGAVAGAAEEFTLVSSSGDLKTGKTVLIVRAGGANPGNYVYYALQRTAAGNSFIAAVGADAYTGISSAPSSISVTDPSLVWSTTVGSTVTFSDGEGNTLYTTTGNELFYDNNIATQWTASFDSETGTFKFSAADNAGKTRYLGLRDDLATTDENGNPRFRCNATGTSSSYQFYLYQKPVSSSHTHIPVACASTEPDCVTAGNLAYWYCSECAKYFSDADCINEAALSNIFIAPTGHTETSTITTSATCIEPGSVVTICDICGEIINSEVLPLIEHNYVEGICSYCGTEQGPVNVFDRVTSSSSFVSRNCVLLVKAGGANSGSYTYYFMKPQADGGSYLLAAAADSYIGTSSIPSSINLDDMSLVWNASVSGSTLSLSDLNGNNLYTTKSNYLYLNTSSEPSSWAISYSSGVFTLSTTDTAGKTRILGLRDDLTSTGANGNPRFRCNATGATTSYEFYVYLQQPHVHTATAYEAVNPTCEEEGNTAYWYCPDCKTYFSDADCTSETTLTTVTIPALGHNYSEEITRPATCTEEGLASFTCSTCNDSYSEIIEVIGHTETVDEAITASCTEAGLTEGSHCSVCGTVILAQEPIPATGHDYSVYSNNGEDHTVACANCDNSTTEAHNFIEGTCPCGALEGTDPYLDTSLVFMTESLNLQSSILSQFILDPKSVPDYDSFYVAFKHIDADGNMTETTSEGVAYYTYKVFEIASAAKEMSDTIEVTLYAQKDGVWYHGETISWILRDELTRAFRASSDAAYKTMAATILNYGAAAQNYFSYNTDDLATALLTAEELAYAKTTPNTLADNSSVVGSANGVTSMGATLGLEGAIQMQFVFRASGFTATDLKARVSYTVDGVTATDTIDGSEFGVMSSYITVVYDKLAAKDLRTVVTVGIYDKESGNLLSPEVSYSAESFCYQKLNTADTANGTHAMCTAIMCYVDAAADYFG